MSYSTGVGGGKTVPQSAKRRASPTKQVVTSSNDESAASVSPLEGAPQHPDIIDPGPHFTNTGERSLGPLSVLYTQLFFWEGALLVS